MKIERMNKGNWGKVRAFFDLATSDGFIIKGFKLIEGINGLFVSMPSQKGNDDEYYDTIWVESKQLRDELNTLAIDTFNESGSMASNSSAETPKNMESIPEVESTGDNITSEVSANAPQEESTGDNITSEVPAATKDTANSSFSDDDIPF